MSNTNTLSPDQIAALHARFQQADFADLDDAGRWALLHDAPEVPNPTPRGTAPPVLTEDGLATLLTDPTNNSVARILTWTNYGLLETDIAANNHARVTGWARKLAGAGILTPAEAGAIITYISTPVPDPDWRPTVPGTSVRDQLFPGAVWTYSDGSTGTTVPLADIREAR